MVTFGTEMAVRSSTRKGRARPSSEKKQPRELRTALVRNADLVVVGMMGVTKEWGRVRSDVGGRDRGSSGGECRVGTSTRWGR